MIFMPKFPGMRIDLLRRRRAGQPPKKPLRERFSPFAKKAGGFFRKATFPVWKPVHLGYQRYITAEGRLKAAQAALTRTVARVERLQQYIAEYSEEAIARRASERAAKEFGVKRATKKAAKSIGRAEAQQQLIDIKLNPKLTAAEAKLAQAQAVHEFKQRRLAAAKDLWLLKNFRANWREKRAAGAKVRADKLAGVKSQREAAVAAAKERIESHKADAAFFEQRIQAREAVNLAQIKANVERARVELQSLGSKRLKLLRTIGVLEEKVRENERRREAAESADSRHTGPEREPEDFRGREDDSAEASGERAEEERGYAREEVGERERAEGRGPAGEEERDESRRELERDMPPRERPFSEIETALKEILSNRFMGDMGTSSIPPAAISNIDRIVHRIAEAEPADLDAALDISREVFPENFYPIISQALIQAYKSK